MPRNVINARADTSATGTASTAPAAATSTLSISICDTRRRARRAERRAHRDLALAGAGTREHERGEISACHQQHEAGEPEQKRERRCVRVAQSADAAPGGNNAKPQAAITGDERRLVARRNRRVEHAGAQRTQVIVRARDGPLRLEPAHDRQPPAIALLDARLPERGGAERQRDVERLADLEARERRRRHADDGDRPIEHRERTPDRVSRPPNDDCQNAWLITAAGSHPLRSSPGPSSRPRAGAMPSAPKKSPLTHKPRARRDSAPRPTTNSASPHANIVENALWFARITSHSGPVAFALTPS